ncbi:chemotaxis protein MotB [Thalassococcus sp. CAU 1522]|uniref:Chemotaxis protein MotB n=1 Tax=Thalassococcus arenae TaxID=2851652 RepID=A0ABS6N5Q4_9RHOB|nr:flagellar motor protein MotB [Thalassococcus arenae]MBV2359351.1 chemotaxis protein MotB [Thalassococcus arenae]
MGADSNVAPVIIRKKKIVVAGGHHGGAWKVAYADFVTAMMAFFMLMWLLNATTEKQRKGLADYFNPTVAVARVSGGGEGSFGGDTIFAENTLSQVGTGATSFRPTASHQARGIETSSEAERDSTSDEGDNSAFGRIEDLLVGLGGESLVSDDIRHHIETRLTDEGLVVELFDTDEAPLFNDDGAPTGLTGRLAQVIAAAAEVVTNPVAIEAHVATYPVVRLTDPSWQVTSERAASFRTMLVDSGLADERVQRMTAHGDREADDRNRMDRRNNRIEVIFLRSP